MRRALAYHTVAPCALEASPLPVCTHFFIYVCASIRRRTITGKKRSQEGCTHTLPCPEKKRTKRSSACACIRFVGWCSSPAASHFIGTFLFSFFLFRFFIFILFSIFCLLFHFSCWCRFPNPFYLSRGGWRVRYADTRSGSSGYPIPHSLPCPIILFPIILFTCVIV